jgi:hypothetical protein
MGSGYANRPRSASIPGTLGLREYELLAGLHRPTDPAVLAAEIRRLHGSGIGAETIAVSLHVQVEAVLAVLAQSQAKA